VVYIGNKWMLGGLTSFGRGCNDGGVYARTSNYYNWILQNLQQDQTLTTSAPNSKPILDRIYLAKNMFDQLSFFV